MTRTVSGSPLVCKFGGTSVADAAQLQKVISIVRSDPRRKYVVVSAPGKRYAADRKITDLLYLCYHTAQEGVDTSPVFKVIRDRFEELGRDLNVPAIGGWLDEVEAALADGVTRDWIASRGEYLHARLVASHLGARFVDAAECLRFTPDGRLDPITYSLMADALAGSDLSVISGFYGSDADGRVKTFPRGGSDISGAVVARAVGAAAYENWTDVDGLLMADPRVVESPRLIREVTYKELRELSYMGATVLHDEAVFPVREAGIPILLRNTNAPETGGTWIVSSRAETELPIVGVAGRIGFSTIYVEKSMMNQELGFGVRVLEVLERYGISFEHVPTGIDSMSVVMRTEELGDHREAVMRDLQRVLEPDRLELLEDMALIATVGQGMSHRIGIASRLFVALADAKVNIRMINQGASEITIIVGVASSDYERAVQAIYSAFVTN
ncbi:MAG TPA: aspartate kinase [Armatimonadota bacterium]|nr:aspartate kinase [Armatimonadota bacterium]